MVCLHDLLCMVSTLCMLTHRANIVCVCVCVWLTAFMNTSCSRVTSDKVKKTILHSPHRTDFYQLNTSLLRALFLHPSCQWRLSASDSAAFCSEHLTSSGPFCLSFLSVAAACFALSLPSFFSCFDLFLLFVSFLPPSAACSSAAGSGSARPAHRPVNEPSVRLFADVTLC